MKKVCCVVPSQQADKQSGSTTQEKKKKKEVRLQHYLALSKQQQQQQKKRTLQYESGFFPLEKKKVRSLRSFTRKLEVETNVHVTSFFLFFNICFYQREKSLPVKRHRFRSIPRRLQCCPMQSCDRVLAATRAAPADTSETIPTLLSWCQET